MLLIHAMYFKRVRVQTTYLYEYNQNGFVRADGPNAESRPEQMLSTGLPTCARPTQEGVLCFRLRSLSRVVGL